MPSCLHVRLERMPQMSIIHKGMQTFLTSPAPTAHLHTKLQAGYNTSATLSGACEQLQVDLARYAVPGDEDSMLA